MHNFTVALCGVFPGLVHDQLTWDLAVACMPLVRAQLEVWLKAQLPRTCEDQTMWVLNSLRNSTRGLAGGSISLNATERVMDLLSDMVPGSEAAHCKRLYKLLDVRGSDVGLSTGVVLDGGRQLVPYPALAWDWNSVQSYKWQVTQHINVLELLAFFNYLRRRSGRPNTHACRILHILDSRVCSCVLAKGRSSSLMLNRVLRRVAALLIVADISVLPLWTISAWNFSDHASRAVPGPASAV